MEKPRQLSLDNVDFSVNELSELLKYRVSFMDMNFYSSVKHCTPEEEQRIIAEINILSAHLTAALMLSAY